MNPGFRTTAGTTASAPNDGGAPSAEPLTIGDAAAGAGITVEAIRYYERVGIIPRAERRGGGRYRRYDASDVERLRFVRRARDLGFSLVEVRELLALAASARERPCTDVNRIARVHLAQVEEKLSQLAGLREHLERLVLACEKDGSVAECSLLEALSTGNS